MQPIWHWKLWQHILLKDFIAASNLKLDFSHHLNTLWGYVRVFLEEAKYNDEYISLHCTSSF